MNDMERCARHYRSMRLYDVSIALSTSGTICSLVGIAYWPLIAVGLSLIVASMFVSRKAARVSPYTDESC
jgi:hypothetical protein